MTRKLWGSFGAVIAVLGAFVACSSDVQTDAPPTPAPSDDDGGATESGTEPDSAPIPTIDLSVEGPGRVLVGDSVDVNVVIQRTGTIPITGVVHVVFSGVTGLDVDPIDIDEQHSTGTVKISVPAGSKQGRFAFAVEASTQGASPISGASAYRLLVAGPPGSLDNSFGTDGVFTLLQTSTVTGVVADGDRVYLGGQIGATPAIVALEESGALQAAFGAAGIYKASVAGTVVSTTDLVGTATGGLYLGATLNGASHTVGALFGVTGMGDALAGFGTSGQLTLGLQTAARLALAPTIAGVTKGSMLVAGRPDATLPAASVQLVQPDGTPSTKYGTTAMDTIDDCPFSGPNDACVATALSSSAASSSYVLCSYRRDGSDVAGVSFDGSDVAGASTSLEVEGCNALLLDHGKTYVAGDYANHAVIARYSVGDTLPDDTFVGKTSLSDESMHLQRVVDVYAQADGSFVAGVKGLVDDATQKVSFVVCRLKQDGSLDMTFAAPVGCAYQDVAGLTDVKRMVLDSDQRLIVVGNNGQMIAARFWQ